MRKARIQSGSVVLDIELRDTPTADALWEAMPISSRASTWGDEVYFSTPVSVPREADATDLLQDGDVAFWTDGDSIAICFGPTPISAPGEMRLASPSNVWARALGDTTDLAGIGSGDAISVSRLD